MTKKKTKRTTEVVGNSNSGKINRIKMIRKGYKLMKTRTNVIMNLKKFKLVVRSLMNIIENNFIKLFKPTREYLSTFCMINYLLLLELTQAMFVINKSLLFLKIRSFYRSMGFVMMRKFLTQQKLLMLPNIQ